MWCAVFIVWLCGCAFVGLVVEVCFFGFCIVLCSSVLVCGALVVVTWCRFCCCVLVGCVFSWLLLGVFGFWVVVCVLLLVVAVALCWVVFLCLYVFVWFSVCSFVLFL